MWKGFYHTVSVCRMYLSLSLSIHRIFLQKSCLQHITDISLSQLPSTFEDLDYVLLYLQLCWKLQDMDSIQPCITVLQSANIPSSYTDLHSIITFINVHYICFFKCSTSISHDLHSSLLLNLSYLPLSLLMSSLRFFLFLPFHPNHCYLILLK